MRLQIGRLLLNEALDLLAKGEPETARIVLRDLVNATAGLEEFAEASRTPSNSVHYMLPAAAATH